MMRLYPLNEDPWDYPDAAGCWEDIMIEGPASPLDGNTTKGSNSREPIKMTEEYGYPRKHWARPNV